MQNSLVNQAFMALSNAGLQVIGLKEVTEERLLKLKVTKGKVAPKKDCYKTVSQVEEDSSQELDIDFLLQRYNPQETRDLVRCLGATDWREAFARVQKVIRTNRGTALFNMGDFINVSFEVPAAEYQGLSFKSLTIQNAKVQIVDVMPDKVTFNFDEIIFMSGIQSHKMGKGSFSDCALSEYLNNEFKTALGIPSGSMLANKDGDHITLLTAYELFGESEYWEKETNWDANDDEKTMRQIPYFKNEKNRVKVYKNETGWYWTSSRRASLASNFCNVLGNGHSNSSAASEVRGVAPAFCVA